MQNMSAGNLDGSPWKRSILRLSQSPIFRKIVDIEGFALRAAILDECQIYLGGGGRFKPRRCMNPTGERPILTIVLKRRGLWQSI